MRVTRHCATCARPFSVLSSVVARGQGRFCSVRCRAANPDFRAGISARARARDIRGANNPNWKGGQVVGVDGRLLVYCPGDPEAKYLGGTHALRYRLVAREKLGRPLRDDEVVHHINGDPTDDRPENLEVTVQSRHARHHLTGRRHPVTGQMLPKGAPMPEPPDRRKICVVCGGLFLPNPHHRVRQKTCGQQACRYARRSA